jgi:hypothetical protein
MTKIDTTKLNSNGYFHRVYDAGGSEDRLVCCATSNKSQCKHEVPCTEDKKAVVAEMLLHLKQKHKVDMCPSCKTLIGRRNMKKHQETAECKCVGLCNKLKDEGYTTFTSYRAFCAYFTEKLRAICCAFPVTNRNGSYVGSVFPYFPMLRNSAFWEPNYAKDMAKEVGRYSHLFSQEDAEQVKVVEETCFRVFCDLAALLGAKAEPTSFTKGGWGKPDRVSSAVWVRKDLVRMVEHYNAVSYEYRDSAISVLTDYLNADQEQRDAIMGIFELSQEGLAQ